MRGMRENWGLRRVFNQKVLSCWILLYGFVFFVCIDFLICEILAFMLEIFLRILRLGNRLDFWRNWDYLSFLCIKMGLLCENNLWFRLDLPMLLWKLRETVFVIWGLKFFSIIEHPVIFIDIPRNFLYLLLVNI